MPHVPLLAWFLSATVAFGLREQMGTINGVAQCCSEGNNSPLSFSRPWLQCGCAGIVHHPRLHNRGEYRVYAEAAQFAGDRCLSVSSFHLLSAAVVISPTAAAVTVICALGCIV